MAATVDDPAKAWNPRYVAYARSHGLTPEAQAAADAAAWPGGRNTGFMLWVRERWAEWRAANGRPLDGDRLSDADHASFDAMIGAA